MIHHRILTNIKIKKTSKIAVTKKTNVRKDKDVVKPIVIAAKDWSAAYVSMIIFRQVQNAAKN